jgi:pyridoxine/pyridoxamine 5'-phosphate oxidase
MRAQRPGFTPGYGIASSDDGLLPWSWVEERLTAARNYWVTTTRADGRPHAAPVWGVWYDGAIVFSTDPASVKGASLAVRPDIVIHLESGDDVVICEGRVERLTDRAELEALNTVYRAKFGTGIDPDNPDHGVYRLAPSVVFAWREADFPTSATRFRPDGGDG